MLTSPVNAWCLASSVPSPNYHPLAVALLLDHSAVLQVRTAPSLIPLSPDCPMTGCPREQVRCQPRKLGILKVHASKLLSPGCLQAIDDDDSDAGAHIRFSRLGRSGHVDSSELPAEVREQDSREAAAGALPQSEEPDRSSLRSHAGWAIGVLIAAAAAALAIGHGRQRAQKRRSGAPLPQPHIMPAGSLGAMPTMQRQSAQ